MKKILPFILLVSLAVVGHSQNYTLEIENDLGEWLPFRMSLTQEQNQQRVQLHNAGEIIQLTPAKQVADTTFYPFVDYHASLTLVPNEKSGFTGYWVNYEGNPVKKRALKATLVTDNYKEENVGEAFKGHWRAQIIRPNRATDAMVILEPYGQKLFGTIRTNAGDYRFLEGKVQGDSFYLSSFSGNSLFFLEGHLKGDSLLSTIHGLSTNTIRVEGIKDDTYEMANGESLTKVINDRAFQLDVLNDQGQVVDFQHLIKGKVVIISVFGTWCPNCIDEINYFQNLQQKFAELLILPVSFEATSDPDEQLKRVQGFKARKGLDFQFLIGGKVGDQEVLKRFPMIDQIRSYPTSFILNKKGEIVTIHTGFNGPATGIFFDQYKEHLEQQIRKLLAE